MHWHGLFYQSHKQMLLTNVVLSCVWRTTVFGIKATCICVSLKMSLSWSEKSMCQLDNQRFIELRLSYFWIISQSPALDVFNLTKTRGLVKCKSDHSYYSHHAPLTASQRLQAHKENALTERARWSRRACLVTSIVL